MRRRQSRKPSDAKTGEASRQYNQHGARQEKKSDEETGGYRGEAADAAITEGARELGVDPSDVEYFVEYAGNPGILGHHRAQAGTGAGGAGRSPDRGGRTGATQGETGTPGAAAPSGFRPGTPAGEIGTGTGNRETVRGMVSRTAGLRRKRAGKRPRRGARSPSASPIGRLKGSPSASPIGRLKGSPSGRLKGAADISATAAERHSEPQRRPEREFVGEKGEHSEVVEKTLREVAGLFALDVSIEALQNDERVVARVSGDAGPLIGRRGKTVAALQYMVSRILNEDRQDRRRVFIDVDGYRSDREDLLKDRAEEAFDLCVREDRWVAMECMPSQDRRFIHMLAQKEETIRTESVGREGYRRVVVFPAGMEVDLEHVEQELERKNSGRRDDRRQGGRGRRGGGGGGGDRRRSRPRN